MSRRTRFLAAIAIGAIATACGPGKAGTPPTDGPSVRLAAIVADYSVKAERATKEVADLSYEGARRDADSARAMLVRLDAIPAEGLSHDETLTRELLRFEAGKAIEDTTLYWYSFDALPALSPMRGIAAVLAAAPLGTEQERGEYLTALDRSAAAFRAIKAKMEAQSARGIAISAETIDAVVRYWRALAQPAATGPFRPPAARVAALTEPDRAAFLAKIDAVVDSAINPAVRALADYVDRTARPNAAKGVGPSLYPGGIEAYRAMVRRETTLEITPEEIHKLALAAMDTLEARMQAVRDSLGWKGTKAEFHDKLRRDPRFYVSVPDSVGARLMMYAARIEPLMPQVFSVREKAPYGAKRLELALEPAMTYGYYTWPIGDDPKGYYFFNGSNLDKRSLLVIGAISFHELIPGHHYQIMRQRENDALPPFRRKVYYAGYGEGWGEYASSVVAAELGMYRDGYEIYGRHVFDAFFIARLVVDTGMNFYGWPRSRAVAYMKEHTLESDVQIESETLRYSTRSPAQALAYRMGRETIVRLREQARQALGAKFDIRRFHEAILSVGSIPLFLLERHIGWWIEQEKAR